MRTSVLYEAIEMLNTNKITPSTFIEKIYPCIKDIVDKSQADNKEDMVQEIALFVIEKANNKKSFNKTFFTWQLETEIKRRLSREILFDNLDEACATYTINDDLIAMDIMLEDILTKLTPREEMVIRKRFYDEMTLCEIGKEFAVSSGRIREIESKAIRKIRRNYSNKLMGLIE